MTDRRDIADCGGDGVENGAGDGVANHAGDGAGNREEDTRAEETTAALAPEKPPG